MAKDKDEPSESLKKLISKFNAGQATVKEKFIVKNILEGYKERKPEVFTKGNFAKEFSEAWKGLEKIDFEKIGKEIGKGISKGTQETSKTSGKPQDTTPTQTTSVSPKETKNGEKKKESFEKKYLLLMEQLQDKVNKNEISRADMQKELDAFESFERKKEEFQKKLKEEHPTTGWRKAKKLSGKVKDIGLSIKNLNIPGLGNVGQAVISPFEAAMWSGILGFSIFLLFWFSMTRFVPMVEGYSSTPMVPQWFNLYIEPFFTRSPIYLPVMTLLATLPLAIVGGIGKVNLKGPAKFCLTLLAVEGSIILLNDYGLPWTAAMFPEQTEFFRCMVKYSGNMQVCALNQTQEVYVDKTGSYQVLTLTQGIDIPSRRMPPINPNPEVLPYYYIFTLTNKNQVGSPYEINVSCDNDCTDAEDKIGIQVTASLDDGTDNHTASEYPFYPQYPISPGGYVIAQAKFTELPECSEEEPYTYFHINLTTDQDAGGSAKFGVIESDEGIDNLNFIYFFDPVVKTQPGPVDVYVYTIPFVFPANRVSPTEPFLTFIKIENKGSGSIEEITVVLIYDETILDIPFESSIPISPTDTCSAYCSGTTCNATFTIGGINGSRTFTSQGAIEAGESYTIYDREGTLVDQNMVGKYTGLISAVASSYRYRQQFDEQIACIQHTAGVGGEAEFSCTQHSDCCSVNDGPCDSDVDAYCWEDTGECQCGFGDTYLCP